MVADTPGKVWTCCSVLDPLLQNRPLWDQDSVDLSVIVL